MAKCGNEAKCFNDTDHTILVTQPNYSLLIITSFTLSRGKSDPNIFFFSSGSVKLDLFHRAVWPVFFSAPPEIHPLARSRGIKVKSSTNSSRVFLWISCCSDFPSNTKHHMPHGHVTNRVRTQHIDELLAYVILLCVCCLYVNIWRSMCVFMCMRLPCRCTYSARYVRCKCCVGVPAAHVTVSDLSRWELCCAPHMGLCNICNETPGAGLGVGTGEDGGTGGGTGGTRGRIRATDS